MWSLMSLLVLGYFTSVLSHHKKIIDLIVPDNIISHERLSQDIIPNKYHLILQPFPEDGNFYGTVKITGTVQHRTSEVLVHAFQRRIVIQDCNVTQFQAASNELRITESATSKKTELVVESTEKVNKKNLFIIKLQNPVEPGTALEIIIRFTGTLSNDTLDSFYRSSYIHPVTNESKWIVAIHPNIAKNVFPSFAGPPYKVPFVITVGRHKNMTAVSNMPLAKTESMENWKDWVWDTFEQTPPMSILSVRIVVSEFSCLSYNVSNNGVLLQVCARPDFIDKLTNVSDKVIKALEILEDFWQTPYPLPKLDIFVLPSFPATRPVNGWGVILVEENGLDKKRSWQSCLIIKGLVSQWLGALATPFWFSSAPNSNQSEALAEFVTGYTMLKIDENETYDNWPISILYSIYYEYGFRNPYHNDTYIKLISIIKKVEFIYRMLNYTLTESTFKHGLQRLIADRKYKTFFEDDIWLYLNEQARFDKRLPKNITVNEIAASWITKDRLPFVTVERNYDDNSATLSQKMYLRDRPHDAPDQEKLVWWIPIVLIRQDHMNFSNSTPQVWMKQEREIKIKDLPAKDLFVIINPEEIGPFLVNYDIKNWNMLTQYLCTENRANIPVNTRAKLFHDAWNLAYAGDLNFATALNMTLCLKYEREYVAWIPVFTFIDHIGRLISGSSVHNKFQTYVRVLLTPLYEELGTEPHEGESIGRTQLRSHSKAVLCQAGYKPCMEEIQTAFKTWMQSDNPDEDSLASLPKYICPIFKFGTQEEWEFALQRVIKFPQSGQQNKRWYLLKELAGCPKDARKTEKLLNITIIEQNNNFTDSDIHLIFSMLTGGAEGYTILFNFLRKNWDIIKIRFEEKPDLWNNLIESATRFKTQGGLDMVSELYVERQSEFGTANLIIEKALKNIKEEAKWSNENLPVIEKWIDEYFKDNGVDPTKAR